MLSKIVQNKIIQESVGNYMKKKVLILVEDLPFKYDNRVKRETMSLSEHGWDVTVLSPRAENGKYFEEINKSIRAYYYPKKDKNSTLGHIFEHTTTIILTLFYTLFIFFKHRFNVIHACNPMDIFWLIYLPYKLTGAKFLFDQHDLSPEVYLSRPYSSSRDLFYKILCWLEKKSYRYAHSIIATNESYKEKAIIRGGVDPSKVFIVRNGPQLNRFDKVFLDKTEIFKDKSILEIGYVGNMNLQDGVEEVVYVCEFLLNELNRKDFKFVLIGGGANQPNLKKLVKNKGLENYIEFTGRIDDNILLQRLSKCAFCIQPDPYNELNNISTMNKIMEYMALGKTFVAYDLKETRVSGHDCGLYAKINDRRDFSNKIVKFLDDQSLRENLGKRGRERIENVLEWKYSVPSLLSAYNNLVKKG